MGTQPRRKKTNAEMKADRAKRENKRREADTLGWNDIDQMRTACYDSLRTTSKQVAEALKLPDLSQKLGEDTSKIAQMGKELATDVGNFKLTLDDIAKKHADQKGVAKGIDGKMKAILVGEEYHQWSDSFNTVVVQRAQEIMMRVEDAYFPPPPAAETPETQGDNEHVEQ